MPKYLFGNLVPNVVAKTTAYTVKPSDCGSLFTNRGASGSVTFTLPISTLPKGWYAEFYTVSANAIVIASNPADTLVTHADATSDSVTTAATIGQHFRVVSDGTGMLVISNPSVATTATAVTAVTIAT